MTPPFSLFIGHLICVYSFISYEGNDCQQTASWTMDDGKQMTSLPILSRMFLGLFLRCTYDFLFVFIQSIQTTFFEQIYQLPVIQRYSGPPYIFTDILYAVSGLVFGVVRKLFFSKECAFLYANSFKINKLIKTQYS